MLHVNRTLPKLLEYISWWLYWMIFQQLTRYWTSLIYTECRGVSQRHQQKFLHCSFLNSTIFTLYFQHLMFNYSLFLLNFHDLFEFMLCYWAQTKIYSQRIGFILLNPNRIICLHDYILQIPHNIIKFCCSIHSL